MAFDKKKIDLGKIIFGEISMMTCAGENCAKFEVNSNLSKRKKSTQTVFIQHYNDFIVDNQTIVFTRHLFRYLLKRLWEPRKL